MGNNKVSFSVRLVESNECRKLLQQAHGGSSSRSCVFPLWLVVVVVVVGTENEGKQLSY